MDYCDEVKIDDGNNVGYTNCVSDEEYENNPDKYKGKVYFDPKANVQTVDVTLTEEERDLLMLSLVGEFASDPNTFVEAYKYVGSPIVVAAAECATENCSAGGVALALVPFGKLKNLRRVRTGRLQGFLRGVREATGGEAAARQTFQQLAGRAPNSQLDQVVQGTREFVFRGASKSSSGVPAVEIIDHVTRTHEIVHFK
jgi:hypothetical protein